MYTALDSELERALDSAPSLGLVEAHASRAERLRALALYAERRLTEDKQRDEKLAAYRELAADEERLAAIEAGTRVAVQHGLL